MITVSRLNTCINLFAALILLLMMIGCAVIYNKRDRGNKAMLQLLSVTFLMMLFSGCSFLADPREHLVIHMTLDALFTLMLYGVMIHFTFYVIRYIQETGKKVNTLVLEIIKTLNNTLFCTAIIVWGLTFFRDEYVVTDANGLQYNEMMQLMAIVFIGLIALLNLVIVFISRKALGNLNLLVFVICLIIPVLPETVLPEYLRPSGRPILVHLAVIMLYIVHYVSRDVRYHRNEAEVSKMKNKMLISVVQPHFIYNVLNSIYYLAGTDSEMTQRAISVFSDYLRQNIDYMNYESAIPFEDELSHLKSYLELMVLRYDKRIKVEFDIQDTDFKIPAMTIQPLVENSIKYGVNEVEGSLIIRITARKEDGINVLTVSDNGPGYHPGSNTDPRSAHKGIANIKERLSILCDGEMTINNRTPHGTDVIIRIK
ncbi:MAG: histidine kinase [Clostridiales bacterium]|nr:histidine kinase [Clostridiales bacterium]